MLYKYKIEDMNNAQNDTTGRLIADGTYHGTVVNVEDRYSARGSEYVSIQWEVDGVDVNGKIGKFNVWDIIAPNSETEKGRLFALKKMHEYDLALGVEDDGMFDSGKLILLEAKVEIKHRKDKETGVVRANVNRIIPLTDEDLAEIKGKKTDAKTPDDFNEDCPF